MRLQLTPRAGRTQKFVCQKSEATNFNSRPVWGRTRAKSVFRSAQRLQLTPPAQGRTHPGWLPHTSQSYFNSRPRVGTNSGFIYGNCCANMLSIHSKFDSTCYICGGYGIYVLLFGKRQGSSPAAVKKQLSPYEDSFPSNSLFLPPSILLEQCRGQSDGLPASRMRVSFQGAIQIQNHPSQRSVP